MLVYIPAASDTYAYEYEKTVIARTYQSARKRRSKQERTLKINYTRDSTVAQNVSCQRDQSLKPTDYALEAKNSAMENPPALFMNELAPTAALKSSAYLIILAGGAKFCFCFITACEAAQK